MNFRILPNNGHVPESGRSIVYLLVDNWNDFSFVTMFHVSVFDDNGNLYEMGQIKIGFMGQTEKEATHKKLPPWFENLDGHFFSLGQDTDYYRKMAALPNEVGKRILFALRDLVVLPELIDSLVEEDVLRVSLLRDVSTSVVKGQYARVLEGKAELTDFKFKFVRPETRKLGAADLSFEVVVDSTPNTNIHAVIGRNGVGKTTLLNGMIEAITNRQNAIAQFHDMNFWSSGPISDDYFSSLVSVSFSAFDPFVPPVDQPDPAKGTCYFYIGLKDARYKTAHRTIPDLQNDCIEALVYCFRDSKKTKRWLDAINKLGSDEIFASMNLEQLNDAYKDVRAKIAFSVQSDSPEFQTTYRNRIIIYLEEMSSGHAVVLLTITRLVATVEEKTLLLLDEPESHLHPPLLSAFVRAISDLLHDRNGVAIVATHSPVVLQEIPSSCVWKLFRIGASVDAKRPEIETFGENVGVITSEVFKLEVERSGFHDLLAKSADSHLTYDEIISQYNGQLGFEGRAILKAIVVNRDRKALNDSTG